MDGLFQVVFFLEKSTNITYISVPTLKIITLYKVNFAKNGRKF